MMVGPTNFPQSRLFPSNIPSVHSLSPSTTAMSAQAWILMPTEMIEKILLYLSPRDLAHTREASRTFQEVIEGSILLFAKLHGYDLGPRNGVSPVTQANPVRGNLDILKEHIRKRFTLDWSRHTFQPPFFQYGRIVDGILVGLGFRRVIFIDLPSDIRGTSYRLWIHNLNFQPYMYVCDPVQDLFILVEFVEETEKVAVHVRHLFESVQRVPGTPIRPRDGVRWGEPLRVRVLGDLVGFLVVIMGSPPTVSLEVYDWKQGKFKAHFMCPIEVDSFCFIAEKVALIPRYSIDNLTPLELLVVDFTRDDVQEGIVTARLIFPGQGPFPRPVIKVYGGALPRRNAPFVTSSQVRIAWFDGTLDSPPMLSPIEILMDPTCFLSFASSPRSPALSPNIVPWNKWGKDARFIPEMRHRYGLMPVHPTRRAYLKLIEPVLMNDRVSFEPDLFDDQALVDEVRVIEFGRMGPSANNTTTATTMTTEVEDRNSSISSYVPLPELLRGSDVGLFTNTLQIHKSMPGFRVQEYRIVSDEERIVILERPYAINPSDPVERRWERDQTLTVFTM